MSRHREDARDVGTHTGRRTSRRNKGWRTWGRTGRKKLRAHNQFQGHQEMADLAYPRIQLMWPARLIPDAWMEETCALGSIDQSVTQWQRFRDAERTRSPPMAALRGRMQG